MAATLKSLPKFFGLTAAQYAALATKDANTLYFVFDEGVNGVIYRGSNVYGETVSYVSSVPEAANALKGVVYFNTTSSTAYVKSGSEMKPVGVLTVDAIDDSSTENDKKVPNVGAVKAYVKDKVASLLHFKGVVDTVEDLPSSGNVKGDCYIVREVEATPYQPAKTNVEFVWVLDAATGDGWEELGSTYDFSIFMQKKTTATAGDFAKFDSTGDTVDSGKTASEATVVPAAASASVNSLANEKEVAESLEAEASARAAADALKLGKGSVKGVEDANEIIVAGGTDDAPTAVASGKKLGGATFEETVSENTMATEKAVQAKLDTKQDKDTDAVENNAAKFDANGNTVDAGKKFGTDSDSISSASAADTLATEKAVASAITGMGNNKQDKDTDAVEGNAAKFDANGQTIDADRTYGTDADVITTASSEKVLATEKAVAAAIGVEETRAKGVEALKLDEISGTNDNILLVAEGGAAVADSGKSISTAEVVPASTATSINKVANELEVAALKETVAADYQLKDKDAVSGNIAKMNASGDSEDSGKQFGGATITTTDASADVLATEEAVIALVNQMAWQTVE